MYFTRMHQERSYVLALENTGRIEGMYIGDGEEKLSFRQYDRYLLLGGQGHRTGENKSGGCYQKLKEAAQAYYPDRPRGGLLVCSGLYYGGQYSVYRSVYV